MAAVRGPVAGGVRQWTRRRRPTPVHNHRSDVIDRAVGAMLARAVRTAVHCRPALDPVAHNAAATVRTARRQVMYRALESIECVALTVLLHDERALVLVPATVTTAHDFGPAMCDPGDRVYCCRRSRYGGPARNREDAVTGGKGPWPLVIPSRRPGAARSPVRPPAGRVGSRGMTPVGACPRPTGRGLPRRCSVAV